MPFESSVNYWKLRIREPRHFVRFAYSPNKLGTGIHIVWGITRNKKVEIQSLRFNKSRFRTKSSVETWLRQHPQYRYIG